MPADVLSTRDLNRATLARQMLLARAPIAPLAAIERLVAMQAQLPRPPFVGLWSRLEHVTRADVAALFDGRKAVRGTSLRATLHVMSAGDFVAFRPTIQPALDATADAILRERTKGLDLDAVVAHARACLAGEPRTFESLRDELLAAFPGGDERAMGYVVRMRLPLVQVPEAGEAWAFPARARFALADEWLGRRVPTTGRARAEDLVLRYLAAYGPATPKDVEAWSSVKGAREAIESLRPRLSVFRSERKQELFDLPDAPRPGGDVPAPVRFMPEYDNLVVARADERFVARADRPRVFLPGLRVAPTVLIDGIVAATWKVERSRVRAMLSVEPFVSLPPRVRSAVRAEAEALLSFLEPEAKAREVALL